MPYGFAGGPIGGAVGSGVRISLKELCLDQHLAIATLVEAGSSEKSSRAAVCDCADMGLVLGDMLDAGACSALCLRIVASHLPKHDFVSYATRKFAGVPLHAILTDYVAGVALGWDNLAETPILQGVAIYADEAGSYVEVMALWDGAQLSAVKVTIGGQALTIAGALAGRTPYQASGNLFADLW